MADTVARQRGGDPLANLGGRPALGLRVLVRRRRLDEELAAGADPASSPMLALRASQLLRPRYRRRLAASLCHLVDEVETGRGPRLSAAVPFLHDEVARARPTLLALAQVLRSSELVHPRGVAMVWRLLSDPSSPLYLRAGRGALDRQAQVALDCVAGQPWVAPFAPFAQGARNGGG